MTCKIECTKLSKDGVSDWCLLDATQKSLCEHMKLLKDAYKENETLKADLVRANKLMDMAKVRDIDYLNGESDHLYNDGLTNQAHKILSNACADIKEHLGKGGEVIIDDKDDKQ